ncbi:14049_t:CDS:10 [Ambispora leptoticha]|uniref:14049_t:CDS:1 n=1 Tax=Ambispora leptoticha TaxID=144679 RepID=A0A9N8W9L6_9GLOM|nr:14049_t:CDS:10 [Ambispora leptoticha]
MHTVPSICPFSGCGKSVDVDETQRRDSVSSQISGTSTLVDEFTHNIEINSQRIFSQDRDVDMAEENSDNTRHEILRAYYFFGEELEKRLTNYKQYMEEHEAQKKINEEVRDQLQKKLLNMHSERKQKEPEKRKVLDCIKKDLEEVANLDDFDMTRKRKAQDILDNWKFDAWRKLGLLASSDELLVRRLNWTAQKNPKRSGAKIENLQVKKIKQFNHATQFNNSHNIMFGGHQEIINTEGTSTQEGEPSSAGMRLREKKKVCYIESPTVTDSSGSEYQDKPKKIKTNKETKIRSSSSPAGSLSSSQSSIPRQTPDLVTDSDDIVEQVQMSEEDFNKFTKAFQKLENTKKWVLTSGKVVEDELYKFGMRCNYEHLCHSFIIDPEDRSFVEENIFSPSELKEIYTYNQKSFPNLPQDLLEYLGSYQLAPYNRQRDFDRDWIKNTVDNFIREYEADSLKKGDHLEGWLLSHVWLFIDKAFENIEGVEVIRGESYQFDDLCIHMGSKEKKVRKLETIGFIHAGLSVLLLRLDSPAGYVSRISRSKMLTIPSNISEFCKGVLPAIKLAWKAKKIVSNVIEMMNENDEENPLQALQQSCENTSILSPPRHVICRTTSFDTPSSKDKKGTSSNTNTPNKDINDVAKILKVISEKVYCGKFFSYSQLPIPSIIDFWRQLTRFSSCAFYLWLRAFMRGG